MFAREKIGLKPTRTGAVLVVLPKPFRGMGSWRKTTGSKKPDNSLGPGPEIVEKVAKDGEAQSDRS